MESWSAHHLNKKALETLSNDEVKDLTFYARNLISKNTPVIFTLKHLSEIMEKRYTFLRSTVERKREHSNYKMFSISKRSGGRRFIHAVSNQLQPVQQWINTEILQKQKPHNASFAFHANGGIKKCAAMHCGARWILKFDISNFFYCINETDVYQFFVSLGYRPLLAFELARICTTLRLPIQHQKYIRSRNSSRLEYKFYYQPEGCRGVLPQGAPTSPMLSNLIATKLDEQLTQYALENGFTYTRYADDLAFSAIDLPEKKSIGKIQFEITGIMKAQGFKENEKKTSVAGPGSKKMILGLLVDGEQPRLSKQMYKKLDRYLYAIEKFGLDSVATHEKFDSTFGFYNHLCGYISFVKSVDAPRGEEFEKRMNNITPPWTSHP
ncbi:RNA-directed DNA polymerase [Shewanella halifaxensis HAW-EB4]|uniref:RNA-directed DNA polymerase n=1 Tax=Shewanella halifaxensis (strain HAW-EB4) TaxID=458817 RepID=B0TRC0_SHEHH|nr:reverse transcriptase family protein [Shewanella halifaxensis]ABZ75092.1 RNA-directed DNA polymerase [Shewanella halifaxensis HAW-EB4]